VVGVQWMSMTKAMRTPAFSASAMNQSSSPATTSTATAFWCPAQPKKYDSVAFAAAC